MAHPTRFERVTLSEDVRRMVGDNVRRLRLAAFRMRSLPIGWVWTELTLAV